MTGEAQSTPLDLAVRSARCALKVKLARPDSSLGISLGHAIKEDELRTDHLVDSAVHLVSKQHLGSIHISEEIKRLLDARFEIVVEPDGRARLLFEKGLREAPRTVLGKEIPCIGRDREIRELDSLFEACVEEPQAQAVVLSGSAGCGKSRVVYEFLERKRDSGHGFELLIGRGDPMRVNVSLGLVGQALRGAAGITGTEPDEVQRKRLQAHTSRFLPAKSAATTAAFLGEIANIRFPDDELPQLQAARRDARLMADQTMAAWVDWLEAEAGHHPVFLLLEDLHWGDFASVNYIDSALRVSARQAPDGAGPGAARGRRALLSACGASGTCSAFRCRLSASGPSRNSCGACWATWRPRRWTGCSTTPRAIPSTWKNWCARRPRAASCRRSPTPCSARCRSASTPSARGRSWCCARPASSAKASAPPGSRPWSTTWPTRTSIAGCEILVSKEILFSRPVGATRQHVFRHALLHQAAYAMLSPKEEVNGHYLAGDFLEEQGERDAIVLADHFEKGQKPERAVPWLRVAANQAMEVDDLKAALDRVERGVRLGAQGDDLAELRIVESEARYWKGEYVEAERAAREGRKCEDAKLALRATSALIMGLGPQAKYEEFDQLASDIETRPMEPELLNAWLDCRVNLAAYLASVGQHAARERTLSLLEAEQGKLDPILIGRAESLRAHIARADGKPAESVARFRRAWECFDQAGHHRASTEALGNSGGTLMELGRLEEAEVQIRKLWGIAERMGLVHLIGGTLYMLSNALAYRGCLDDARAFGENAVKLTTETNDQYFRRYAQLYLSVIEYLAGNYSRAAQHARTALEILDSDLVSSAFCPCFACSGAARTRLDHGGLSASARSRFAASYSRKRSGRRGNHQTCHSGMPCVLVGTAAGKGEIAEGCGMASKTSQYY